MKLHTVIVSYNRLPLLQETVRTYLETVTLPFSLLIVDNGSDEQTVEWLEDSGVETLFLGQNHYPGYAANRGFERAPETATHLHRSDNDARYLAGWCAEVYGCFQNPELGQLGLRTEREEGAQGNVGGNMILRKDLFPRASYSDMPWSSVPFEDDGMTQAVSAQGATWGRAQAPCIVHTGIASSTDPYYQESFRVRGITFRAWGIT